MSSLQDIAYKVVRRTLARTNPVFDGFEDMVHVLEANLRSDSANLIRRAMRRHLGLRLNSMRPRQYEYRTESGVVGRFMFNLGPWGGPFYGHPLWIELKGALEQLNLLRGTTIRLLRRSEESPPPGDF